MTAFRVIKMAEGLYGAEAERAVEVVAVLERANLRAQIEGCGWVRASWKWLLEVFMLPEEIIEVLLVIPSDFRGIRVEGGCMEKISR